MSEPVWTAKTLAEIEAVWREGALDARQIAAAFGTTRNAILGLAHRCGWPSRDHRRRPVARRRSTLDGTWRPDRCQWIEGAPSDGVCGGEIARPEGSYCAEHQARAYRPPGARLKGEVRG